MCIAIEPGWYKFASVGTAEPESSASFGAISQEDVRVDIDQMLWAMKLADIRRYAGQRFWEEESQAAWNAMAVERAPRLDSVAEHSWHVADTALLLAGHFPFLNAGRCAVLAVLHDKMEILTGDYDPLGSDGTGKETHAFNEQMRRRKTEAEKGAIDEYVRLLRPSLRAEQTELLYECLEMRSAESCFVKAVDKLQALAFVLIKKAGHMALEHLSFTLRFSGKAVQYFPGLALHYQELRSRLLKDVAAVRECAVQELETFLSEQGRVIV